jgi:hypothetical protein
MPAMLLQAAMVPHVPLADLWLPIVLAGVIVWIIAALFWTVGPHHQHEFGPMPGEDRVMAAMRDADVRPGHYVLPFAATGDAMKSPEYRQKLNAGPVGFVTIGTADNARNMAKPMLLSLIYYLVISLFVAYITSRTVAPGARYLVVFRVAGATAFLAYGAGIIQDTIWFQRGWVRAWKHLFDALVMALFTAGVFGWRWPGA